MVEFGVKPFRGCMRREPITSYPARSCSKKIRARCGNGWPRCRMTQFEPRMTREARTSNLEATSHLAFRVDSRKPVSRGGDGLVAAKQCFTEAIGDEAVPAPFSNLPCIAF